jgi:hypothetical protein
MLVIVAIPLTLLFLVPLGYFAAHASFHAVWQTLLIAVLGVVAWRSAVRRSRLPGEVVSVVMLLAVFAFALASSAFLPGGAGRVRFAVFAVVFGVLAAVNLWALARAWRGGWRPVVAGDVPKGRA